MTEKENQRYKEIKIWKLSEASPELKAKIIEKFREMMTENQDNWYAEDQGILYDKKTKTGGYEIFEGDCMPKYWNVGYGHSYIQFELTIKDKEKFDKIFGVTKSLRNKIEIDFKNEKETNTELIFRDLNGEEIDLESEYRFDDESDMPYPTKKQFEKMYKISKRFDDIMDDALKNLRANFEHEYSDEGIAETIEVNEYDFDENGDIVR